MSTVYVQYPQSGGGGSSSTTNSISFSIGTFDGQTGSAQGASISSASLFMQGATATLPGLVSSNSQTFAGVKTFSSAPNFSSLSPSAQLALDGSKNVIVSSVSLTTQVTGILPAGNIPPLSGLTGSVSLTGQVSGILPVANGGSTGSNSGDLSIATFGATPNSAGGSIAAGQILTLQPADGTTPGGVTAIAQTFGGVKTFAAQVLMSASLGVTGSISATGVVSGINVSGSNTGNVSVTTFGSSPNANGLTMAAGQVLNMQPADGSNPGGVSTTTQTFAGAKTFSAAPVLSTLSVTAPVLSDGSKNLVSGSVSLSTMVTGNLPLSQTSGSVSLTNQVSGSLALSQTTGSLSYAQLAIGTTFMNVGAVKTASATDNWHSMASNSVNLTTGVWLIGGSAKFGNSGSSPIYTDATLNWFSTNGGDNNTIPTILNSCSGLTILSGFYNSVFNGSQAGGSGAGMPSGLGVGTGNDALIGQTVLVQVTGTATAYLVTYSTETTAANTRIGTYTWAVRLG